MHNNCLQFIKFRRKVKKNILQASKNDMITIIKTIAVLPKNYTKNVFFNNSIK